MKNASDEGNEWERGVVKVVVITGSARRRGTSALLAERFIEGAEDADHETVRFDAAVEQVGGCRGCNHCGMGSRPCVQSDSMLKLGPHLLEADVIAFVTPLYFFGMSAQLKATIDRLYAFMSLIRGRRRTVLLATAWDSSISKMGDLVSHYETIVDYCGWEDAGQVLAVGCGERSMIECSAFPDQAYALGASL